MILTRSSGDGVEESLWGGEAAPCSRVSLPLVEPESGLEMEQLVWLEGP